MNKEMSNTRLHTLYTVQYGNIRRRKQHGAHDADFTLCGKMITDGWWITSVDYEGNITCAQCLRELAANPYPFASKKAKAAPKDGPSTPTT